MKKIIVLKPSFPPKCIHTYIHTFIHLFIHSLVPIHIYFVFIVYKKRTSGSETVCPSVSLLVCMSTFCLPSVWCVNLKCLNYSASLGALNKEEIKKNNKMNLYPNPTKTQTKDTNREKTIIQTCKQKNTHLLNWIIK